MRHWAGRVCSGWGRASRRRRHARHTQTHGQRNSRRSRKRTRGARTGDDCWHRHAAAPAHRPPPHAHHMHMYSTCTTHARHITTTAATATPQIEAMGCLSLVRVPRWDRLFLRDLLVRLNPRSQVVWHSAQVWVLVSNSVPRWTAAGAAAQLCALRRAFPTNSFHGGGFQCVCSRISSRQGDIGRG